MEGKSRRSAGWHLCLWIQPYLKAATPGVQTKNVCFSLSFPHPLLKNWFGPVSVRATENKWLMQMFLLSSLSPRGHLLFLPLPTSLDSNCPLLSHLPLEEWLPLGTQKAEQGGGCWGDFFSRDLISTAPSAFDLTLPEPEWWGDFRRLGILCQLAWAGEVGDSQQPLSCPGPPGQPHLSLQAAEAEAEQAEEWLRDPQGVSWGEWEKVNSQGQLIWCLGILVWPFSFAAVFSLEGFTPGSGRGSRLQVS